MARGAALLSLDVECGAACTGAVDLGALHCEGCVAANVQGCSLNDERILESPQLRHDERSFYGRRDATLGDLNRRSCEGTDGQFDCRRGIHDAGRGEQLAAHRHVFAQRRRFVDGQQTLHHGLGASAAFAEEYAA